MADDFQEKTERATPKKREKAREKGQVARSMEVNSAAMLFFGLIFLYFFGGFLLNKLSFVFNYIFVNINSFEITPASVQKYYIAGISLLGSLLMPVLVFFAIVGLVASIGQIGFQFTPKAAAPKLEKLNPLSGFKKIMFSKKTVEELVKNVLKISVILYVAYKALNSHKEEFLPLLDSDIHFIFIYILKVAYDVSLKIALAFIFIAVADFAFQRYDHEENLKMSKQEVKDEMKESEGDPKIKSAIRRKQLEMAMQRMMQAVPEADVVITNPTHFAVALKYDPVDMPAPKILAKGKDLVAQRIKELASENDIPIVENPPLARALFAAVDVDQYVPVDYFQAVAEVLAYVYKLKNKTFN